MPPHHLQNRAASTRGRFEPVHAKSYDHIARIWPDRGVDCRNVADCCPYRLVCSAFQAVAGRGHDGIRDTHSGRDGGHRFIDLSASSERNYPPADTARDMLMSAFDPERTLAL